MQSFSETVRTNTGSWKDKTIFLTGVVSVMSLFTIFQRRRQAQQDIENAELKRQLKKERRLRAVADGTEEKSSLPDSFLWGTATASYQIEGAWNEGGKSPSIWDTYTHEKGNVINGDTGDVACDHYHHLKEDVNLMAKLGTNSYRFSLSWTRLIPGGVKGSPVNEEGIKFYSTLIDLLLEKGITPLVTLYHWDLPQAVQDDELGFLNPDFHEHFAHYARVCFESFGDRVKNWITFNEPWCICALGFAAGMHAPGRLEDTGVEPYIAAHHLLIAHANTYHIYHEEFNHDKGGKCGITLNSEWFQSIDVEDVETNPAITEMAQAGLDWTLGWFASPIWGNAKGEHDYPLIMKDLFAKREGLKERVVFADDMKAKLKNCADFLGLNHYSTQFVTEKGSLSRSLKTAHGTAKMWFQTMPSYSRGIRVLKATLSGDSYLNDIPVSQAEGGKHAKSKTAMNWDVVPFGFRKLLQYIHSRYAPPGGIIVTENGCAYDEDVGGKGDAKRIAFLEGYLTEMKRAIESGVDVRGYFLWSFLDNFEWSFGYEKRFGLVKVNYDREDRKRTPRQVFHWYKDVTKGDKWAEFDTSYD